ncbi:MAG TPA: class I SAM-dependent methyltransferase [Kofleriaceae bacterium]|nr:class I SAM-dependent methyltransferase [Kofleriaceae bacterium]
MDLRERPSTVTVRHPWEAVRARFFCRVLASPLTGPVDLLDIGAGDGFFGGKLLDALPEGSSVTCVDPEYTDGHLATLAGHAPGRIWFARTPPDREFDAIVILDVLEHIADDRGFLREFVMRRLRPGGRLLISVPAHPALYTQHDVALGHYRRYSQGELRDVLVASGLAPLTSGNLFGSLLAPRVVTKLVECARGIRSRPVSGPAPSITTGLTRWQHGRVVTSALEGALEIDARLCALAARVSAPSVGLSAWALCERPRSGEPGTGERWRTGRS